MAGPTTRAGSVVGEFFTGFATLFRGFGWWRRRPDLMFLGLLPALIVMAGIVALVLVLSATAEGIVTFLTPFADAWDPVWSSLLRIGLAIALLLGVVLLAVVLFTGLTLLIGDWFYERIWRSVEADLGGLTPAEGPTFWRGAADAVGLMVRAGGSALLVAAVGLIPVVGTVTAAVLGFLFSSRILAAELTTRPLEARGLDRAARSAALRTRRVRSTGFGVAVQLCFLVPGGAVLVMPAAVAGATHLARDVIEALPAVVERAPVTSPPPAD